MFSYGRRSYLVDGVPMVEVDLPDGKVELPSTVHQKIAHEAQDDDDYRTRIITWMGESHTEWKTNRGPDSDLGRNMEAGGPHPTSHGD